MACWIADELSRVRALYPDQMERSILGMIYEDDPIDHFSVCRYRSEIRAEGRHWSGQAHSMIGHRRLRSLRTMCEEFIQRGVRGDFIEAGVGMRQLRRFAAAGRWCLSGSCWRHPWRKGSATRFQGGGGGEPRTPRPARRSRVDDYGALPNCKTAVHDFRSARGITEEIHTIDWTGVYWRKGG